MDPKYVVYDDGIISVGLFAENAEADDKNLLSLGIRWLPPKPCKGRDGQLVETTNVMGGETSWFLLPHSFGLVVGRTLVEQNVAKGGLEEYFNESAFKRMVSWLVEMEGINSVMCY